MQKYYSTLSCEKISEFYRFYTELCAIKRIPVEVGM